MISLFQGDLSGEAPRGSAAFGPEWAERERWRAERPAWTQPGWWDVDLRAEVRALLWLPAGAGLATAVAGLSVGSRCCLPHAEDQLRDCPAPGSADGWPCACQVIVAAAWEACASWVAANAANTSPSAAGPAVERRPEASWA